MVPRVLDQLPRRNALIVVGVAGVVLVAAIVLLWSKGESGSTASFCSSLRSGPNPIEFFDRYDPTNPAAARDVLQPGADRLRQLERAAPGEIHADVKVLVDFADELVAALDPATKNKTVPDFAAQSDRISVASANVTRFASDTCGVQLDSGASAAPATLPTTGR